MNRWLTLFLTVVLILSAFGTAGCGVKRSAAHETMWRAIRDHDHLRHRLLDRTSLQGLGLLFILSYGLELDDPAAGDDWIPATLPPPRQPVPLSLVPSKADPFSDHVLDGVWQGITNVFYEGGFAKEPFLIVANASDDSVYVSVLFLDINHCLDTGRADWTAVYSDKAEIDPRSGELSFDRVASKWLKPFVPDIVKLNYSYSAYPGSVRFAGQGEATHGKERQVVLQTRDEFFKLKKPGGITGLWSSGFTDRVYAGEFLEPPIFHPVMISLVERGNGHDMDFFVLYGHKDEIEAEVTRKRLTFEFWTPNGMADGDFRLEGRKLVGRAWDNLLGSYMDLTFLPAGTTARAPKIKAVKPKNVGLATPGKVSNLTVVGKNFVPGSLPFFDRSDIELRSVEYVSKKKLQVQLVSPTGVPAGTAVSVKVINPDNRSATKTGAFLVR